MVRCGRSAVFMWLRKLHTIEGHVLCHATVVSSTNLLKAEECRRLYVLHEQYSFVQPSLFTEYIDRLCFKYSCYHPQYIAKDWWCG